MLLNTKVIFLSAVAFITLLKPTSAAGKPTFFNLRIFSMICSNRILSPNAAAVDYKAASAVPALERRQFGQLGWNDALKGYTFNNFELFNNGQGSAQYWGGNGWSTLNSAIYANTFTLNDLPRFPVIPAGAQPFLTRNGVAVYRGGAWQNRAYFVSRVKNINRFGYFPANYALGGFQGLSQAHINW